MAPDGDLKKMIANLEALTIEFADELALLNVKVSTLEDTVKELQGGHKAPVMVNRSGDIGFTAFASFALVTAALAMVSALESADAVTSPVKAARESVTGFPAPPSLRPSEVPTASVRSFVSVASVVIVT